jgi:hypothetical protein
MSIKRTRSVSVLLKPSDGGKVRELDKNLQGEAMQVLDGGGIPRDLHQSRGRLLEMKLLVQLPGQLTGDQPQGKPPEMKVLVQLPQGDGELTPDHPARSVKVTSLVDHHHP